MKKEKLLFCILLSISTVVFAQKLPNKQEISLRAPADVKVDGKINEWGEPLMAYNKQVDLFYTIANDDENIYIVIHSAITVINRKIMDSGIAITLNSTDKKEKGGITITYPYLNSTERSMVLQNLIKSGALTTSKENATKAEMAAYWKRRDSLTAIGDKKTLALLKNIKIEGIKEIHEQIITTNNQAGIKVAALPAGARNFNYEIAIPIKYLGALTDGQIIHYKIQLPGPTMNASTGTLMVQGGGSYVNEDGVDLRSLDTHTDFWGEYKLAKK